MIRTIDSLLDQYKNYRDPHGKIKRDVQNGLLLPLIRGIYETDTKTSGLFLASVIYGPSYLSFDYALSYHGLIPERVTLYTSATFNKRRSKLYKTSFGNFSYQDIPKAAYPYATDVTVYEEYVFFMAKPEKALLDKLYTTRPVSSQIELSRLIFDGLRIDRERFKALDRALLLTLIPKYKSTTLNLLKRMLRKDFK